MEITFRDKMLALVETDQATQTPLSVSLIKSLRHKLHVMRCAPDERTLRNWKSLHYEKLDGSFVGKRSIRINDQWRLIFTIDTDSKPNKITVLSIEDYH